MSKTTFENYGLRAASIDDPTVVAGRYSFQREAERLVVGDVAAKLALQPRDTLLEIGFGAGALSVPLSYLVERVTAIDHPAVVKRFQSGFAGLKNVSLLAGNFFELDNVPKHSKVLAYGVLQCLADYDEVVAFIDKALHSLEPGGMMLVGDVPNVDRKQRFLSSPRGKAFSAHWPKDASADNDRFKLGDMPEDNRLVDLGDESLLRLMQTFRAKGVEVFSLPEPAGLPFGHTREDLLFTKHQ
jgi:protein-L-isoaspartate O-methyltransferase